MPVNYIRVYGGWEERLNPNYFQRQAWFRQRSRRMNSSSASSAANKNDVRRSASEESLLDNLSSSDAPPAPPRRNKAYEYEQQTPTYPRKSSMMMTRRLEMTSSLKSPTAMMVSSISVDSEVEQNLPSIENKTVSANLYRESNGKTEVPTADEPFVIER